MKFKSFFASVLAFAAIAIACEPVEGELKEASLKIEGETSFTVDSKSQTVEVSILSTRDWTATSSAEWVMADPDQGSASDKAQKVEITVLENTSYDRTATVTFSIGTLVKKVTITQTGTAAAPDGTKENPFDVASAVAKCKETGETVTSEKYYTKGIVSSIKDASGIASFGNVSFYITDDGAESETKLLVFQALYLGGEKFTSEDQLKVGDEVVVYGALVNYKGNTPETDGKGSSCIVSLNGVEKYPEDGGTTVTEPKGTGTAEDPFNAAAANLKCIEVGQTASTEDYYVKGIISKGLDISTQFGNATFYISDDGTTTSDQFYVYRCYYIGGEKFASTDQLKIGDEVVVKGKLVNYYGNTPEMTQGGEVVSVNGGTEVSDYLSISKASAEVPAAAGSIELSVASNTTWTVSCSESFVTLSTTGGEGDGTVTVSYAENTASEARSAVVSFVGAGKTVTFTLSQLEAGAAAANELSWAKADWNVDDPANVTWTNGTYTVEVHKNNGSTNPAVRDNGDIRAYAKATIVVSGPAMSSISIVLASDAGFRYCEITADCGDVAAQAVGDTEVRWSGSSETVTFTVGDYATLGSDGESKAGQLRFNKILVK